MDPCWWQPKLFLPTGGDGVTDFEWTIPHADYLPCSDCNLAVIELGTGTELDWSTQVHPCPPVPSGAVTFDGNAYFQSLALASGVSPLLTVSHWVRYRAQIGNIVIAITDPNDTDANVWYFDSAGQIAIDFSQVPFAVGSDGRLAAAAAQDLRDGRWHHIAVVLLPRDDAKNPLEVNQYVDGRLEGEGRPSPSGSDIFKYSAGNGALATNGSVWLGCRLGINGVRTDRFTGEMDELFIFDRALEPHEIVRLGNSNQIDE